jgi:hypothetical protein
MNYDYANGRNPRYDRIWKYERFTIIGPELQNALQQHQRSSSILTMWYIGVFYVDYDSGKSYHSVLMGTILQVQFDMPLASSPQHFFHKAGIQDSGPHVWSSIQVVKYHMCPKFNYTDNHLFLL